MRRHRGFTLPELLIYAVVVILLLAAVYAAFHLSWRYYQAGEAASEAQQEALKATSRVSRTLNAGLKTSLLLQNDPPALRFLSAEREHQPFEVDDAGQIVWQRWVCLYYDQTAQQLVLKERELSPASATVPNPGPTIAELVNDNSLPKTIVARGVTATSFGSIPAANGLDTEVTYSVTCTSDSPRMGTNSITLQSRALVRNEERS